MNSTFTSLIVKTTLLLVCVSFFATSCQTPQEFEEIVTQQEQFTSDYPEFTQDQNFLNKQSQNSTATTANDSVNQTFGSKLIQIKIKTPFTPSSGGSGSIGASVECVGC